MLHATISPDAANHQAIENCPSAHSTWTRFDGLSHWNEVHARYETAVASLALFNDVNDDELTVAHASAIAEINESRSELFEADAPHWAAVATKIAALLAHFCWDAGGAKPDACTEFDVAATDLLERATRAGEVPFDEVDGRLAYEFSGLVYDLAVEAGRHLYPQYAIDRDAMTDLVNVVGSIQDASRRAGSELAARFRAEGRAPEVLVEIEYPYLRGPVPLDTLVHELEETDLALQANRTEKTVDDHFQAVAGLTRYKPHDVWEMRRKAQALADTSPTTFNEVMQHIYADDAAAIALIEQAANLHPNGRAAAIMAVERDVDISTFSGLLLHMPGVPKSALPILTFGDNRAIEVSPLGAFRREPIQ